MAITLRGTKGSALTHPEMDTNFSELDIRAPGTVQKATLDKITEAAGLPLWMGAEWPGTGGASPTNPSVTTGAATSIGGVSFTVPVTLNTFGSIAESRMRISVQYHVVGIIGWSETAAQSQTTLGTFNVEVSGLTTETNYEFRARAYDALSPEIQGFGDVLTASTVTVTVDQPTLTVEGYPGNVPESPLLETTAFSVTGGSDTHLNTDWQILNAALAVVWESLADAGNLLSITVPAGLLVESTAYTFRARHRGAAYGAGAWAEVTATTRAAFAMVIGVAIDSTGGNGGTFRWVDAAGNDFIPGAGYFDGHPLFGGIVQQVIDSQYMAKVPKGYSKTGIISGGSNNGKKAWWVSDISQPGFEVHPAFMEAGSAIDQFWNGSYQGTDGGSSKLASQPGVPPLVNLGHPTFITRATNRNTGGVTGFMMASFWQWAWIQRLYLIENKSMNCQVVTGDGRVNAASAANTDAADVAQATYRGMVGLWGNVYQWLQGVKTIAGRLWVWDKLGNRTWIDTGVDVPNGGWFYPLTFSTTSGPSFDLADAFIPATTTGIIADSTCPDGFYWKTAAERAWLTGGAWSDASLAGLWCANVSNAPSHSGAHIGSRLAKV